MSMLDSQRLPRHRGLPDLLKRVVVSHGSVALRLTASDGADEIEAFLIALFEVTDNPYSVREQDDLIRAVVCCAGWAEASCRSGCGVEIRLTGQGCEVHHAIKQDIPAEAVAAAMLQALAQLDDPAGMMLAGLASAWDGPSIRIAVPRSATPPIY